MLLQVFLFFYIQESSTNVLASDVGFYALSHPNTEPLVDRRFKVIEQNMVLGEKIGET